MVKHINLKQHGTVVRKKGIGMLDLCVNQHDILYLINAISLGFLLIEGHSSIVDEDDFWDTGCHESSRVLRPVEAHLLDLMVVIQCYDPLAHRTTHSRYQCHLSWVEVWQIQNSFQLHKNLQRRNMLYDKKLLLV